MPEPKERKFKVLIPGQKYACTTCGQVFEGMNCRNWAIKCYESHDDSADFFNVAYNPQPRQKRQRQPGECVEYPDSGGHHPWARLSKRSNQYNRLQTSRSLYRCEQYDKKHEEYLDRLISKPHIWKDKISPLQRLSYAFHYGGWEAVKQAAYNLAYSEAITKRLDEMNIPDVIRDLLHLDKLLNEMLGDLDFIKYQEAKNDLDAFLRRLEMTDFIEGLNIDDFEGENKDDNSDNGTK